MPNSDTQYGLHNKLTKEYRFYQVDPTNTDDDYDGTAVVVTQSFSGNVETAKSTFLTADGLANNDTNATRLEYAITADGNGLKMSIAFGTKGAPISEADDWADTWATTKAALTAADNHVKQPEYTRAMTVDEAGDVTGELTVLKQECRIIDATPHLF